MGLTTVLYPKRFEIFRLEALGDEPYFDRIEAQRRYDTGRGLSVVPQGRPPAWFLHISVDRYRFTLTFYAVSGTPIRQVDWEQHEGRLLRRRTIDLFYPDGDPGRRVPYDDIITVTRQLSADGVSEVTMSSPAGDDDVRASRVALTPELRLPLPQFGEWDRILTASLPPDGDRFGLDAVDAAIALAEDLAASGRTGDGSESERPGAWRRRGGVRGLMRAVDAEIAGESAEAGESANDHAPVIGRGAARILPVLIEDAALVDGLDPREARRRIATTASEIRDACEHREGRAISIDLSPAGTAADAAAGETANYAAALRAAGATESHWWAFGDDDAVVLVSAGAESSGPLTLAVHIVPRGWVQERRSVMRGEGELGGWIDLAWSWADVVQRD